MTTSTTGTGTGNLSSATGSGRQGAAGSWGLSDAEISLHKRRLLAFYTVHAPAKAHNENVDTAWNLFGPRIWDELERKYRGKTVGFRPSMTRQVGEGGGSS